MKITNFYLQVLFHVFLEPPLFRFPDPSKCRKHVICNNVVICKNILHILLQRASCTKPAAGLLPCCHQADIRMRSHRLLRLVDNKSAASCQQA